MNIVLEYTLYFATCIIKRKYSNLLLCYDLTKHSYEFYKNPRVKLLTYTGETISKKSVMNAAFSFAYQCCLTAVKIIF